MGYSINSLWLYRSEILWIWISKESEKRRGPKPSLLAFNAWTLIPQK